MLTRRVCFCRVPGPDRLCPEYIFFFVQLAQFSGVFSGTPTVAPAAHPDSPARASGSRRPCRSCGRWNGRLPATRVLGPIPSPWKSLAWCDSAGDDQLEVVEIGVYVEGETVRGYGAGDVDADGGDFGFVDRRTSGPSTPPDNSQANCPAALGMTGLGLSRRRSGRRCGSGNAESAQVRIRTSSRRRTYSMAPRVLRLPSGWRIRADRKWDIRRSGRDRGK